MALVPLRDKVLIQRKEPEEVTAGGIVIPDIGKRQASEGVVVAVGTEPWYEHGIMLRHQLDVGETVVFGKYAGIDVTVAGTKYVVLSEHDILGIILP